MSIAQWTIMEMQQEAGNTRKLLERVPADKLDFKPHEKSMALGRLASHIADNYSWAEMTMGTDELDFDPSTWVQWEAKSPEELVAKLDESLAVAVKAIEGASDETMMKPWKMKVSGQTVFEMPKIAVIRNMMLNHTVHHRGQLEVYLRMNDVPLPAIYGPSADEQG